MVEKKDQKKDYNREISKFEKVIEIPILEKSSKYYTTKQNK